MRLDDVMLILKAIALFRRVEPEALRVLSFSAVRRQLRSGDVLFRRGDPADGGYLVVEGALVLDPADDGAPSPHVYGVGSLIGQSALFAPVERPATAIAREASSVLVFTRDLVGKVLDAYPQAAKALQDALAEEARDLARALERAPL